MAEDKKRIALFLDGTWNNVNDNTNVWRLKSLCAKSPEQMVYYSAGVGTQLGEHLSGGMFGIGINEEVINAYEWLVEHYEADAQLFIFGFSRGAFTARSLAGFISKCGLLKPGSPVSMKQLYERYRKGTAQSVRALGKVAESELPLEDRWIKKYSRAIPIWFQGVWDTGPPGAASQDMSEPEPPQGPSFLEAVRNQLGLELKPGRVPLKTLVIDQKPPAEVQKNAFSDDR